MQQVELVSAFGRRGRPARSYRWLPLFANRIVPSLLVVFVLSLSANAMADGHSYVPVAGFVPDERTAIQIAEAVLTPIYGADAVKHERPFTATLNNGFWTVVGSLPPGSVGGTALVEISRKDGHIQRVSHGR